MLMVPHYMAVAQATQNVQYEKFGCLIIEMLSIIVTWYGFTRWENLFFGESSIKIKQASVM